MSTDSSSIQYHHRDSKKGRERRGSWFKYSGQEIAVDAEANGLKGAYGLVRTTSDPELLVKTFTLDAEGRFANPVRGQVLRDLWKAAEEEVCGSRLLNPEAVCELVKQDLSMTPRMIMQRFPGVNLTTWIKRKLRTFQGAPVKTIRDIRAMFLEIARCIHAKHREGVVHGDISPGNIIIHDAPASKVEIFLIDAAFVRQVGHQRSGHDYASPSKFFWLHSDLFVNKVAAHPRHDIWGLFRSFLFQVLRFYSTQEEFTISKNHDYARACQILPPEIVELCDEFERYKSYESLEAVIGIQEALLERPLPVSFITLQIPAMAHRLKEEGADHDAVKLVKYLAMVLMATHGRNFQAVCHGDLLRYIHLLHEYLSYSGTTALLLSEHTTEDSHRVVDDHQRVSEAVFNHVQEMNIDSEIFDALERKSELDLYDMVFKGGFCCSLSRTERFFRDASIDQDREAAQEYFVKDARPQA